MSSDPPTPPLSHSPTPAPWWVERRASDVRRIIGSLEPLPEPRHGPVLVIMTGLPGSGKSYLARRLAGRLGAVVLHSDRTRKLLVPRPQYTERENARVFPAMHEATGRLLDRGLPVIFDATNLLEGDRRPLYRLAEAHHVPHLLVRMFAPPDVIKERLASRVENRDLLDFSDADWEVYLMMEERDQPPNRDHLLVTADEPIERAIERIVQKVGA